MSIINQVLNELEKRGVNAPFGEDTLRSVTPHSQLRWPLYALLAAMLLILLVAAKWYLGRSENFVKQRISVTTAPAGSTVLVPASAPSVTILEPVEMVATSSSDVSQAPDSLHGKPLLVVNSEEEPVAVPKVERAKANVAEDAASLPPENLDQLKTISPQQRAEMNSPRPTGSTGRAYE